MASMSAGSSSEPNVILTEAHLRNLSRHVKDLLPSTQVGSTDGEDINKYLATFHSIIDTCSSETLPATHQVAAWNALSTFVDQCAAHPDCAVRTSLWTEGCLEQGFQIFLSQSSHARPRSIKQLLTSLTIAIQKTQHDEGTDSRWKKIVELLVKTVLHKDTQHPVRPCLLLLSSLLKRDILDLDDIDSIVGTTSSGACVSALLKACMQWALEDDTASTAGQLLAVVLDKAEAVRTDDTVSNEPLWVPILSQTLLQQSNHIDAFRHYLMPTLFKRDHSGFLKLLQRLQIHDCLEDNQQAVSNTNANGLNALLAAIQIGNDSGLVELTQDATVDTSQCPLRLPVQLLASLLRHSERSVRLSGLALLINTPIITQPFHKVMLDTLKSALPHLHADTDLNFRSGLFSLTHRFLDRLRTSTAYKARAHRSASTVTDNSYQQEHDFILWYRRFLTWELRPGASYQRHISALRCLATLMRSGVDEDLPVDRLSKSAKVGGQWPFHVKLVDDELEETLISVLLDSFDDVRQTTAHLLDTHFSSQSSSQAQQAKLRDALLTAERMMLASGRADQADAVAHLYALLYSSAGSQEAGNVIFIQLIDKAEHMLQTAETSLAAAVERYPLHGVLTSLRYLLEKPTVRESIQTEVYTRIACVLHKVWQVVRSTLCDDAPEGFLPEEIPASTIMSSKMVLSYCWRALKEGSLLTDSILLSLQSRHDEWALGYQKQLIELTFAQLAELRHRGAFSTVAQTWNRCCGITDSIVPLSTWMGRVMTLIQRAKINTRRSAGMPSLICGILIADHSNDLLEQTFTELDAISRQAVQPGLNDESSLPQVHAMNCLKDILKSTKLASRSEQFIPIALQLAADSLPSKAWALRNCGLMLFRAVIDRLLKTNDSYEDETDVRTSVDFRQRKALLNQVLSLLPTLEHDVVLEGVFPALQLLQYSQLPQERKEDVQRAVTTLLGNKSWLIRDKAARTLVTLMSKQTVLSNITIRLQQSQPSSPHNLLHGLLLCLKHVSRSQQGLTGDSHAHELAQVRELAQRLANSSQSPVVQNAAQDLIQQVDSSIQACAVAPSTALSTLRAEQALRVLSDPATMESWLTERSMWLEAQARSSSQDTLIADFEDWTAACESAADGSSVFSSESVSGAICSLDEAFRVLWARSDSKQTVLRLSLLVYDLLNDDEEDIRIASARCACKILALHRRDSLPGGLEPLVASHRLLAFMVSNNAKQAAFADECLRRAFGVDRTSTTSILQFLQQASSQDTDLFAEEKQNLYLDETLEAKAWLQAVKRLPPTLFHADAVDQLTHWTQAGLDALFAKAQESASEVLGWSTTEMVFPLGLRIIYATEFLLHLANQRVRLTIRPSSLRENILKLQDVAQRAQLHPLWRAELDRVSKIAALSGFSAIQTLLNGVVNRLDSATTLQ